MNRPKPIPVEESFNEFVIEFGGELVSSLMSQEKTLPRNADYLFRNEHVIAELKCLEKNSFNNDEDVGRLGNLIQKWTSSKIINGSNAIKWLNGQERLPSECYQDMINLAARTIETAIRSAKKQIELTKVFFDLPEANGVLLLVNDGNYFLEHQHIFALTCQIMERKFKNSSIDGFVYFSVNMPAVMPEHKLEMLPWFPAYRDENNESLGAFINKLGEQWIAFYRNKIGQEEIPIHKIKDFDEGVEKLQSMRYLKK
ncbi:MAG: hypothetical protein NVS3B3_02520 [Aquirhabdus sp.]